MNKVAFSVELDENSGHCSAQSLGSCSGRAAAQGSQPVSGQVSHELGPPCPNGSGDFVSDGCLEGTDSTQITMSRSSAEDVTQSAKTSSVDVDIGQTQKNLETISPAEDCEAASLSGDSKSWEVSGLRWSRESESCNFSWPQRVGEADLQFSWERAPPTLSRSSGSGQEGGTIWQEVGTNEGLGLILDRFGDASLAASSQNILYSIRSGSRHLESEPGSIGCSEEIEIYDDFGYSEHGLINKPGIVEPYSDAGWAIPAEEPMTVFVEDDDMPVFDGVSVKPTLSLMYQDSEHQVHGHLRTSTTEHHGDIMELKRNGDYTLCADEDEFTTISECSLSNENSSAWSACSPARASGMLKPNFEVMAQQFADQRCTPQSPFWTLQGTTSYEPRRIVSEKSQPCQCANTDALGEVVLETEVSTVQLGTKEQRLEYRDFISEVVVSNRAKSLFTLYDVEADPPEYRRPPASFPRGHASEWRDRSDFCHANHDLAPVAKSPSRFGGSRHRIGSATGGLPSAALLQLKMHRFMSVPEDSRLLDEHESQGYPASVLMPASNHCKGPLLQPGSLRDESDDEPTCGDSSDDAEREGTCSDEAPTCTDMEAFRAALREAASAGRREVTLSF